MLGDCRNIKNFFSHRPISSLLFYVEKYNQSLEFGFYRYKFNMRQNFGQVFTLIMTLSCTFAVWYKLNLAFLTHLSLRRTPKLCKNSQNLYLIVSPNLWLKNWRIEYLKLVIKVKTLICRYHWYPIFWEMWQEKCLKNLGIIAQPEFSLISNSVFGWKMKEQFWFEQIEI